MPRESYLAVGARMRARLLALQAEWPTLSVLPGRTLADVAESDDLGRPTVHVVYVGERIDRVSASGHVASATQTWAAVISVRDLRDGTDAEELAGQLIGAAKELLQGWTPPDEVHPLIPITAPATIYRPRGVVRYPLCFTVQCVSSGARPA